MIVVYDANIIYPSLLRDLLIRLARSHIFQAKWTDKILDEMVRSILSNRPDLEGRILDTPAVMKRAVGDALVTDYEYLIPTIQLPDPNDRHVLAAAIKCGASTIVTDNLKDFPDSVLSEYDIRAINTDQFLSKLFEENSDILIAVMKEMSTSLTSPPIDFEELLNSFSKNHIPETVEKIWEYIKI